MKNMLQFSGAVFIPQIFALVTLLLLTRNVTLADYGSIAILEALLMLITPLASLGVDRASAKYATTLGVELVHGVGNGIVSASSIAFFIPYFCVYFLLNIGETFRIDLFDYVAIYIVAYSYNLLTLLQVKNQFSGESFSYLIAAMIKTFLPMVFISIGIMFLDLGAKSFIYGLVVSSIILIFYTNRKGSLTLRAWWENWNLGRSMISYGLPLLPAFISGWIISWSNRFFLGAYVSEEQLGLYSAVFKYSLLFFLFVQAVNLYITPVIYRLLEARSHQKVETYLVASIFLFLFGAFIYAGVMVLLLPYFGVTSSTEIIVGVSVFNYLSGIAGITTQLLLLFYKKTKELMYGSVFYAVICIASYWVLIPKLQIVGVLLSNVVCVSVANVVFLILSNGVITLSKFRFFYMLLNLSMIFICIAMMIIYF